MAFLFAKKRRCAIFAFASGGRRFHCLYTEKRKNIFAADRDNTAFFVPAWRRRTAFVYLYAGTATVWAGSYRRADLSVVAAAMGGASGVCIAEIGCRVDGDAYLPQT